MASQQLCWTCKKACGGDDCPWANRSKPVEGWTAEKRRIKDAGKVMTTYHITACPLYVRDKK
ncbi:MAG: hypothetical protein J6A37_06890 [Oscillospiraceae bacterium]|nr:hypothetical protein [Oscillospiraceae bacterium]